MLRAILLLLLLWFGNTDASLFTSSNPSVVSSIVTLYSNTSSIDNTPPAGGNTQIYDHNIVLTNSTKPSASGLGGILYDRQQSCQQNTTSSIPNLLTSGQPKIALVEQGGGCSFTDKAWYSQQDNAIAVIIYSYVPFNNVDMVTVGDNIKIPVYFVNLEIGQTLLRQLQQPSPIIQAGDNVTYQTAVKVVMYPSIGGFPTAWEFILIIVVALLTLSFLISMGMHWHLWRIRRRQRAMYEAGVSMAPIPGHSDKKVLDPASLTVFPTRIIGTDQAKLTRRNSTVSLRTERALENAQALAATIIHSKRDVSSVDDTVDAAIEMEPEQACVICLDEFGHGESVRKLPCGHEYHCECIDPWLTIKSASCPLCKYDCSLDTPKQDQPEPDSSSSIFSLSFLRRHMDEESAPRSSSPISTFGPTIPADQAEAFSQSWMARSLPRNMRRQINLAAEAQRQENSVITLPARMMTAPPQPVIPHTPPRRLFTSLPLRRPWGRSTG